MSADDDRAAFEKWIRDDGYLVSDAVTPIEWDDEGLPVYYTRADGVRRYLDGEWHGWRAAIAAEREACEKAVLDAGGDNADYHAAAIRARGAS